MSGPRLTKANAETWRRGFGNRVYAAEQALPARHHFPAPMTDLAAAVRECLGDKLTELRWGHDNSGRGTAYYGKGIVVLGKKAPLFVAYHEAAHILASDHHGHGQPFVDAYLGVLERHAPPRLHRSLRTRLRWQDFNIDNEGETIE